MRERLNLRLFFGLLAVLGLLGTGIYFLHDYQVASNAEDLREMARGMESQGRLDKAERLLALYLPFAPGDVDARIDYAGLLEKLSASPKARVGAINLYERILTRVPDRADLRKRLVNLQIRAEMFTQALVHLKVLQGAEPKDANLAFQAGLCHEGRHELAAAVADYGQAIELAPNALVVYRRLADLQRKQLNEARKADEVMDRMVRANPGSPHAFLLRARYRLALGREVEEDLRQALALAPGDVEVLLTFAEAAGAGKHNAEARGSLKAALEKQPDDARLYHALAVLEAQGGDVPQAIAHLRQGLTRSPGNEGLLVTLATLLTDTQDTAGAHKALAEMRRWQVSRSRLALAQARLDMAEGKWKEARATLEANRPVLAVESPDLAVQIDLLLGRCYEQLGDGELELAALRRAARAAMLDGAVQAALGRALVRQGRMEEALAQHQRLVAAGQAPAEAQLTYVKLLILQQLALPAGKAHWRDVEDALEAAAQAWRGGKRPAEVPEPVTFAVLRAEVLAAKKNVTEARRILDDAAVAHPKAIEVPMALAELLARQGKAAEGMKVLQEARKRFGPTVELDLAGLRLASSPESARSEGALAAVEEDLPRLSEADRVRLLDGLAEGQLRWRNLSEARRLWLEVASLRPQDLPTRLRLFELAAGSEDLALMEQMAGEIRGIEGADGPLGHYSEALLRIGRARQGDLAGLREARQHLTAAERRRPAWAAIATARAMIAELAGKTDEALAESLRAVDLGERRPGVIRQTVQRLYDQRRYTEADQLIRRLNPDGLLSGELQKLAAELSLRNADPARALELAAAAVPADSKDPKDLVWLAQVLQAAGRNTEAHAVLQRAVSLAGPSGEPWLALVHYHLRLAQKKEAAEVIAQARQKLQGPEASAALAQCYEAVGQGEQAEAEYRAAVGREPAGSVRALRELAGFYQRTGSTAKAVAPLRQILNSGASLPPADLARTRRALAVCLASGTDYARFREALGLLDQNLAADPKSAADLYAKARVLGSRPGYRKEALGLMQELARRELTAEQQYYLARLHTDAGDWPGARKLMLEVLAREDNDAAYVLFFVEQLFHNGENGDAEVWLDRLEGLAPADPATRALRALALVKRGQDREALAVIEQAVRGEPAAADKRPPAAAAAASPEERLARQRWAAKQVEQLAPESADAGKVLYPAAEEYYRKAAAAGTPADGLALASYLGRRQRLDDALAVCEQLKGKASPEEWAGTATGLVCGSPATPAQLDLVERSLKGDLEEKPNSRELRSLLAALQARRGRYAEAEASYRALLRKETPDAGVLNNLAFMLVLQNRPPEEALELMQQAVSVAGPLAELLDTRGMIYLQAGRVDRALEDLNEAVAQAPTPARYFHAAQALHQAGRKEDAARMFAKAAGVEPTLVLPAEQQAYRQLRKELETH
jgi:tetratricopeptide (TPR) repeat protein